MLKENPQPVTATVKLAVAKGAGLAASVGPLKDAAQVYFSETMLGVRQRAKNINKDSFDQGAKRYTEYVSLAADSELLAKSGMGKHIKTAAPTLGKVAIGVEFVAPFVVLYFKCLFDAYRAVLHYTPPGLLPAVWGAVLCFFGGEYITVIAAVEAFELCGGAPAAAAAVDLYTEAMLAIDASIADDASGALAKMEPKDLAAHKSLLVLRTVDPEKTQHAAGQLYLCWMAMLATLKIQFARTVALGLSICKTMHPIADKHVVPMLLDLTPAEYQKWVPVGVDTGIKAAVVLCAWIATTVVATVQSALRGGTLFSTHVLAYLGSKNYIKTVDPASHTHDMIGFAVALAGILFQVANGWGVPFPFSVLFWPLNIVEWFLRWQVSVGDGLL